AGAPTDTPTPTIVAAPAPSPVPTAAPSPTATPVQPTATPTPDITQAPSEPGPGLTGEQMAAIMLTQEDIDTEFPSLEFDPDTSGFADNADAAEDTFDPDDIEADITAAGRITGYEHEFADFSSILGGSWEGPLAMVTAIHVLEDEASASAYLTMLAEEPMRFADVALDGGTLRSSAPLTPGTILGEESAGFQTEMEVTELDSSFLMYGALWRRGSAVLLIYLVGAPGMEPGESVWRLAARMDDRVAPALAGKITAVPLAAAFEELEPVPGEDTTELEQRALAQGYDLRALTDLSGLLPGFQVSSESFSLDGTEIGFERDYEPDSISAPVGDSTVMMVGTDFDLFETEFEAVATMGIISAMDPETWADLFALGLASEMGADVDSVEVEKLEVPGKDVTGFSASFGFLQFHMYFVAGGRLAGLVMMMGTELRAEDTMPLAAEIKNRASEVTPQAATALPQPEPTMAPLSPTPMPAATAPTPASDRDVLVALYNATDGANWENNDNWLSNAPLGEWYGVDADGSGRVTRVVFTIGNGLNGVLPVELGNLTNLKELSLGWNELSGEIPPWLDSLARLEVLRLEGNELSGEIPTELGSLRKLEELSLGWNQLRGNIPPELGSLAGLRELSLSHNLLTGEIPHELGNLSDLEDMGLYNNLLSGEIPAALGNLANVREFNLASNELSGEIPPELGNLANVEGLFLNGNNLIGGIPPELGSLANLQRLGLSGNRLSGEIPPELGRVTSLRGLYLEGNQLSGCVPSSLRDQLNADASVIESDLGGLPFCKATSPTPTATPASPVFVSISAGEEHTCGVKTDGSVACWGNNDDGQATPPSGSFASVGSGDDHTCGVKTGGSVVCWGDNSFDQSAPPAGSFTSVSAGFHHTCGVKTDGSVACWGYDGGEGRATPPAGSFTSISAGSWHTCGIKTSGSVACWGKNDDGESTPPAGSFIAISAGVWYTCGVKTGGSVACWGSDSLDQATPPGGSFTSVSAGFHHTCGVKTDGSVDCWGYDGDDGRVTPPAGSFTAISAGDDHTCGVKTDGSVVCWGSNEYGQATPPGSTIATTSEATPTPTPPAAPKATGSAASDRAVLVTLYNAVDAPGWVFENWLSDASLGEWQGVTTDANGRVIELDLGAFLLDGEIPPELGRLSSLEVLNLWGNGFRGKIPSELGNLANLRELYLWSNELSGEIPSELGNLANLATMQLTFNQLSGEIPPELGNLTSLERLDLSENRLSGAIPAELGSLPNLLFLYLADNQFTGCVPASVGNVLISDIEELGLPPC
ncbi:MAG: hypothetical protein F4X27_19455, partial [Chloroflexi bacterium]|nr:hypothetical protein [Chloroflexota bacterium]